MDIGRPGKLLNIYKCQTKNEPISPRLNIHIVYLITDQITYIVPNVNAVV